MVGRIQWRFGSGRQGRVFEVPRLDFRAFLSLGLGNAAVRMLVGAPQGDVNAIAHAYRTNLIERGSHPGLPFTNLDRVRQGLSVRLAIIW
jgi:hypothetical protein